MRYWQEQQIVSWIDYNQSWTRTSDGAQGYDLHLLDVFSYRGWRHQQV